MGGARNVLVTGGGSGLGRAAAVRFARDGDRVAVCGRREGPLEETAGLARAAGAADVRTAAGVVRIRKGPPSQ